MQKTFYANGKKHQIYNYSNFLINGKYERFYDDGTMMFSGELKDGYIIGEWDYNIKVNEKFAEIINLFPNYFKNINSEVIKDGIVSFKVNYIHVPQPVLYHGFEMKNEVIGNFK